MRRYVYSNLLSIINNTIVAFVLIPTISYFCILYTENQLNLACIFIIISFLIFWILFKIFIKILDAKSKNYLLFEKDKIIYKNRTFYANNLSIRYFKFYVSVLETCMVFPKVLINVNGVSIIAYLSKKDVREIEKLGYNIKKYWIILLKSHLWQLEIGKV